MVVLMKRLPGGPKYDAIYLHLMTKQKDCFRLRGVQEQMYTWIQGVGEDNRDPQNVTKMQTKE